MMTNEQTAYDTYVNHCKEVRSGKRKYACTGMARTGTTVESLTYVAKHFGLTVQLVGSRKARIRAYKPKG